MFFIACMTAAQPHATVYLISDLQLKETAAQIFNE